MVKGFRMQEVPGKMFGCAQVQILRNMDFDVRPLPVTADKNCLTWYNTALYSHVQNLFKMICEKTTSNQKWPGGKGTRKKH